MAGNTPTYDTIRQVIVYGNELLPTTPTPIKIKESE